MISQDIRSHERFGAPILQRISEIKTNGKREKEITNSRRKGTI